MDKPNCVSILQLTDISVVSTLCLLWIMLLWTYMYKFLCRHMFSFLLGRQQGSELLGHMATVFNLLKNLGAVFQSYCIISQSHQQCITVPISLLANTCYCLSPKCFYSYVFLEPGSNQGFCIVFTRHVSFVFLQSGPVLQSPLGISWC